LYGRRVSRRGTRRELHHRHTPRRRRDWSTTTRSARIATTATCNARGCGRAKRRRSSATARRGGTSRSSTARCSTRRRRRRRARPSRRRSMTTGAGCPRHCAPRVRPRGAIGENPPQRLK